MSSLTAQFRRTAEATFAFLPDRHAFRGPTYRSQSWQFAVVAFDSELLRVEIMLEHERDLFVYVRLKRNGSLGRREDPGQTFLLDSLIANRSHGRIPQIGGRVSSGSQIRRVLERYATELEALGSDLLSGGPIALSDFQTEQRRKVRLASAPEERDP